MLGAGADEGEPVIFDDLHEIGVFGQKPIAGVDRLCACDLAGGDDGWDRQIAVGASGRADADAFIGHAHMHGIGIGGGMHGDRLNAHFAAGADHAQRDLPAVGDEDFSNMGQPLIR
jgi:hypothetical protein